MSNTFITLQEANELLQERYPSLDELEKRFPFGKILKRLWDNDERYSDHGPAVLEAMNSLLSSEPGEILYHRANWKQKKRLEDIRHTIRSKIFSDWDENVEALFRIAALYHDIGKYIIKERHPSVGWHTLQYLDPDQKTALRQLLMNREDYLQLLLIMIRDHDHFGVLSTGEASYPILVRAANSLGEDPDDQMRVISALMLCNLADMAGIFDANGDTIIDGYTIDLLIDDWELLDEELRACPGQGDRLDDYLIHQASDTERVIERIRRLLVESSRGWKKRREELNDLDLIRRELSTVFGTERTVQDFATQFTHVCKLDYGKRFFEALMEYCEGPPEPNTERRLPIWSPERLDRKDVLYAVLAILKRITTTYAPMMRSDTGLGHLIGVELKDLTPESAPEKTTRIVELIIKSHYPGLTWMMSDVPAWYF
jgi:hypothetical protein